MTATLGDGGREVSLQRDETHTSDSRRPCLWLRVTPHIKPLESYELQKYSRPIRLRQARGGLRVNVVEMQSAGK